MASLPCDTGDPQPSAASDEAGTGLIEYFQKAGMLSGRLAESKTAPP
jgi:hypothetical protein